MTKPQTKAPPSAVSGLTSGGNFLAGTQAAVPPECPTDMHLTKDLVHGRLGGQRAVKDAELSLESLRNVIASTTGMDHGCQELHVYDTSKFPRLL